MTTQFGSFRESINILTKELANFEEHNDAAQGRHYSSCEAIRHAIRCLEEAESAEMSRLEGYYHERKEHLQGEVINWEETDLPF